MVISSLPGLDFFEKRIVFLLSLKIITAINLVKITIEYQLIV